MSPVLPHPGITRLRACRSRKGVKENFFNTYSEQSNGLTDFMEKVPPGTSEIGIHPGQIES